MFGQKSGFCARSVLRHVMLVLLALEKMVLQVKKLGFPILSFKNDANFKAQGQTIGFCYETLTY